MHNGAEILVKEIRQYGSSSTTRSFEQAFSMSIACAIMNYSDGNFLSSYKFPQNIRHRWSYFCPVDYRLSFTDQGKQTSVFHFHLQQKNRSLPFPFSAYRKQMVAIFRLIRFQFSEFRKPEEMDLETRRHGDIEMETWKHADIDMETWKHKEMETRKKRPGHGDTNMETWKH
jgi:hypothetical protein